ncbi:glycosyltransferase family 5 protein [Lepidopterella palustris CBS 459.81]|uniref:alpha-1,3-glucan synthase n=1 Tax=Lepidopterella palustris CBS 459.81 TaxID=1314670 RepID=A0A8E2J8Z7_9PEZI|nr:glycosyltransferase family 5 protein [Lepidopterella palustris CBS 459.81]
MRWFLAYGLLTAALIRSLKFDAQQVGFNLNENNTALDPLDFWGEWQHHTYQESPSNWRFPFYTLFLDRFVNGDPSNDDANGTVFEFDVMNNQLRHGGDLAGLIDTLDYIQGMGIKGLYIAGTPFINMPWKADGYSPLDLTLLDRHFGDISEWRLAIDEIHRRGMYVVLDNTMSTMGDLIGFEGFLNTTTPFSPAEHKAVWKTDRHYQDFTFGNTYKPNCEYPRFWNESGFRVLKDSDATFSQLNGCYDSEFDQYGDTEAFGVFPDWQRQLSKFASVQDRLREWVPSVREKIQHFSCITIAMLDIDGFRFDKATQVTVDAQAEFGESIRDCARRFGKTNFFMPGEITGGNTFGSIYLGRGRQPDMLPENLTRAVTLTNSSSDKYFLRDPGKNALDAAAFHYSIYRSLTRFLGMDGNLTAGFDVPVNFVDTWNTMLVTNDFVNPNTGEFDPKHMYGVTNQDVFRWPAIKNGTQKMLLGLFIATLHMPGIPLLLWGEEQTFYVLDSTAANYIFGRQPMSSALAWQNHGCYRLGSSQYYDFPIDSALDGCNDDSVSLDHRDPTHPVRNIIKSMYQLRRNYPVLNDGYFLQSLSNQTHNVVLPGSNGTSTEIGLWSVLRDQFLGVQNLTGPGPANQSVWLVYQNDNHTINYLFDCASNDSALISPFDEGTIVKNLLAPYDEVTLKAGPKKLGIGGSENFNGCLENLELDAWGFKAYVPAINWVGPPPMLTKFLPGHDARLQTKVGLDGNETVDIELQFSEEMDCDHITQNLVVNSTSEGNVSAKIDEGSVSCANISDAGPMLYVGGIASTWSWKAKLEDVSNGVHSITVRNASTSDGKRFTDSIDRLQFRIGKTDNPMVFPRLANYSQGVLFKDATNGSLFVSHKASGSEKWRYSLNWGSSWSEWKNYEGGNSTLAQQPWSGTKRQKWRGDHVILQYWSRITGSSDSIQHADANWENKPARRFPHLFAHGPFNEFGFDGGITNDFQQDSKGLWKFHLMTEWPSVLQVNVWGMNPDGQPDQSFVFGDTDNDTVLDRTPPDSLTQSVVNFTALPPRPYLAYRMELNDGNNAFRLIPAGNRIQQVLLFALLWSIPVVTGAVSIWTYMGAFYGVKFNKIGVVQKKGLLGFAFRRKFEKLADDDKDDNGRQSFLLSTLRPRSAQNISTTELPTIAMHTKRRTVLIATMEYDIEDWNIKIKIGGLGVMAQLMGKNLSHQDLIWVVPCVGGVDYPIDQPAESMTISILGSSYEIQVQYHTLRNITYVLLDAPVFRQQTKSEPYPPRMDDLDSAIYYSAWNACIAETIKRFPVDIYHINDYHGAAAPLYLLPQTIPCCLSLHNAEFQGLWPMRTPEERKEVCNVFNLEQSVVESYVQFGEVFNLLHAGASYLRVHQKGFGAVGVSNKYGERSYARYPIFWGLKEIGKLPNPDPSDTEPWDKEAEANQVITVDPEFEASRGDLRRQAQEWAQLDVNPNAELFVFVGRWSNQKGVDLIADVFPAVLEKHSNVQLICVGPVIDLYGKFAALKLGEMMKKYPRRVYSKPEFTALPPYIFTGAEFALIPSRDEPFGLVAVEFGRKGALGVGARVGGLGQMPGWWYTVESTTTKHLQHQFKLAIEDALASKTELRALMRARSAKQRFPVAKWVEDLGDLQSKAIKIHQEQRALGANRRSKISSPSGFFYTRSRNASNESLATFFETRNSQEDTPPDHSRIQSSQGLGRTLSLGVRAGPGHRTRLSRPDSHDAEGPILEVGELDDESQYANTSDEYTITSEQAKASMIEERRNQALRALEGDREGDILPQQSGETLSVSRGRSRSRTPRASLSIETPDHRGRSMSPSVGDSLLTVQASSKRRHRSSSALSLNEVIGSRSDYKLQKVDPTFNDTSGEFYRAFEQKLQKLDGKTSEGALCIEEYLVDSEKTWFKRMRDAKLRKSSGATPNPSVWSRDSSPQRHGSVSEADNSDNEELGRVSIAEEFLLGENYKRPSFLNRVMQTRIGDWPIYSLLLALGQIIAANSYQITLLTGGQGETPEKLYILGSIYIVTSCIWWVMFRTLKSRCVLSIPFLFYGLSFVFIGIAPFVPLGGGRDWIRNVAAGMYIIASSSGSIFFALNFGDEGGAPIKAWVYRACVIQGTQQIYITALFYWGSTMTSTSRSDTNTITSKPIMAAITIPIAFLLWAIGIILFTSLPPYYRQSPGKIPSFYHTLLRRKIVGWFFVTVVLQNYFLSTPYGRNWAYLWSSRYAPHWAVGLLVLAFFIGVWASFLAVFSQLSKNHSWILPIFAIGLGAPRWAQMLWGTSGIGLWVPWMPGGPVAGALAGRALWLWLGVLDSIQGVGFGMMLLQTLTRIHIAVSLVVAQLLGAVVTMLAKATAPDRDGPGDVFPDFSAGIVNAISKPWFWIALACQLVIPIGFFKFFRKEQLSKP